MHVLLTGGAGFIGSHLAEWLVGRRGVTVAVLDDLSSGRPEHLAACAERARLTVGSVLDRAEVARLVRGADRVVHLAATVGVDRVAAAPGLAHEVIAAGSKWVLDAAAERGVPAILVSSSEVYGFAPGVPAGEEDALDLARVRGTAPRLAYVRAKIEADAHARELAAAGLPVLAVRPFNVVGARQAHDGGAVLPRFVRSALAGLPLQVHGDGTQRRCFLEVRDLAALLGTLALAERFPRGALNAGATEEHSIVDLARLVVDRLGSRSAIVRVAPPRQRGGLEVPRRVPSLERLRATVAFAPRFGVQDAIDALAGRAPASRRGAAVAT